MSRPSRHIIRVMLAVDVHVETDPGMNTPDGYEPPSEYLVVRGADVRSTTTFGDPRPLALAHLDGFEDHDPDDLIRETLKNALDAAQGEKEHTR